jgi:dTDP-4-dehydrorhamnose reductase/dTDP-4-dehydrorhamnose 3,5-epimerase
MNKIETNLKDCYILEPKRFGDNRGYFSSVTEEELMNLGFNRIFQVSNSLSGKGIVRGLHFQRDPYCQAKVVRCHRGAVLDVVVDMRKDSPSYGKWTAVELTPENGKMLYVPRGFAHGFVSLKDDTLFEYYVDNLYKPKTEGGILWNDPELNIPWDKIFKEYDIKEPILSGKDQVREGISANKVEFFRKPKKFLVTGINGQLGHDIVKELHDRGEYDVYAPTREEMDITDSDQVKAVVTKYKPDVIIHCAAWTAVDKAEDKYHDAVLVNIKGTKNMTDASNAVGAKLMYMSTDYVFDGKKEGLYTEEDLPNPKNTYGLTKYLGEQEVKNNPNHFIARISWVFGINGNNFVKTMLKLSEKYDKLNVVSDQIGSPTYTKDLARLLVEMSYTDKYGTYNITNDGYCSWAEFAEYIMKTNNRNTIINPITTEEYAKLISSKQAYRPKNSKLSKDKLVANGFDLLPTWQDATDRYSKELIRSKKI